jgi:hypothetical protein
MTNPITPPPELVKQWLAEPEYVSGWNGKCVMLSITDYRFNNICAKAAQWGADQELEACCEWIPEYCPWDADQLRAARRPQPPNLKEQALNALEVIPKLVGFESERDAIRRALEALDD